MDGTEAQKIKSLLLQNDDQYRELDEQHHQLDHRLHELINRFYPSTSEQFERATLKKRKLALKDRMEKITREYTSACSHAL